MVVCLGGSATNDGGVGMAAALGIRFLDVHGRDVADGGAALLDLARIDGRGQHPAVAGATFLGATDVENPLCGPAGASHVYGPQKGASPDDVFLLDRALAHLAAVVHHDLGIALKDEPGAGAAGGLGFGLLAFCGARLRRGVDVVMEAVDLGGRMEGAALVITGEGSLDTQSLYGKVPAGVIRLAELHSVPVAVLCGRSEVTPDGVTVRSLVDRVGEEAALGDARRSLELLASELAARPAGRGGPMSSAIERFSEGARALGLHPEVRRFPEGTKTADAAAQAIGCDVGQIVKSLIFMADDRAVLALTSGRNRVDEAKLASLTGAGEVRRATPEEAREATGFAVGGTPPFAHTQAVQAFIDGDLLGYDEVWAAAGTPDSVFPLSPADLVRVSDATTAAFTEDR